MAAPISRHSASKSTRTGAAPLVSANAAADDKSVMKSILNCSDGPTAKEYLCYRWRDNNVIGEEEGSEGGILALID